MFRAVVGVMVGFIAGGVVNMGLVTLGPTIIPTPEGVDVTTTEGIRATAHLLEPRHFVFPFLAHALGTFVGVLVAFLLSGRLVRVAWIVGGLGLAGGITAAFMIPAPAWFVALDLIVAYLPMTWLAIRIAGAAREPA
jgi:hypothetical protein